MAAASGRRCHYEVLGLRRESTADEIRSAYKKLALQLHPDKLVQSGLSQSEATARFQELSQAYEVLSDPKERAWYDSHRSQILFTDPNSADSVPDSVIPNLFSFFSNSVFSGYSDTGKGFYKVYSDVFSKIYANELSFASKLGLGLDAVREAPAMGNLESPYTQVTAFYGNWLGFSTVMDFCWVDQYDAMAGVNRKSRRVMEEENKKLRKKARREYNETVRGLAEFVKKRDKRVIDMAVKKNLGMEKRREEERERKNKMERERLERAMAYEEPEWSRIGEEEEAEEENVVEEVEEKKELYCVVCGKKFKSEKQWKNHEQSKKHREKVAEFRESVGDEEFEDDLEGEDGDEKDGEVEELEEKMRDGFRIGEEEEVELSNGDDDEFGEVGAANGVDEDGEKVGFDAEDDEDGENADNGDDDNVDDEIGVLEAMLGRRRKRKKNGSLPETNGTLNSINVHVENDDNDDDDDDDFMDYNKRKTTRRNRRARKERSGKNGEEAGVSRSEKSKESNGDENLHHQEESSSRSVVENESNGKEDDLLADNKKSSNQHVDKKGKAKNDTNAKSKNSSRGKKAKATSKNSSNACEKCGEEFESKNILHKHLTDTGHATLKCR